jgi:hypothetical protein
MYQIGVSARIAYAVMLRTKCELTAVPAAFDAEKFDESTNRLAEHSQMAKELHV